MNTANQHKKIGKLILKNRPVARTIYEIVDLFNIPRSRVHEGKGFMYRGGVDLSPKVEIWWPKIEPLRPRSGWVNQPQYNTAHELTEISEKYTRSVARNCAHINELKQPNVRPQRRIVFARFKGGNAYEYIGVFQFDANRSVDSAVWVKVADDCNLNEARISKGRN